MSDPNINMKPMKSQIRAPAGKSEMWIIIHRHRQSRCSSGSMEYLISLKAQVERVKPWIKDKIIRLLSHWEGKILLCKGSLELDHEWHTKKHHRPLLISVHPTKFTNPMDKAAGIHMRNRKGIMNRSRERTAGPRTRTAVTQRKWKCLWHIPMECLLQSTPRQELISPSSYPGFAGEVWEAKTSSSWIFPSSPF